MVEEGIEISIIIDSLKNSVELLKLFRPKLTEEERKQILHKLLDKI